MKPWLLSVLACPRCQGDLRLDGPGDGDVQTGRLVCRGCAAVYPIRNGVADFAAGGENDTARGFARQWSLKEDGRFEPPDTTYGIANGALVRRAVAPLVAESEGPGVILDAGCGAARKSLEMARQFPGHQVIGIDLSGSLFGLPADLLATPNLHILRADLQRLPLRPASIHVLVCHGVIHHLDDQPRGVEELLRVCAPGAGLSLWLYPVPGEIANYHARVAFRFYYGLRDYLFLSRGHRLPGSLRYLAAGFTALLLYPWFYLFLLRLVDGFAREFEQEDYRPRRFLGQFRGFLFMLYDDLLPRVQTRYGRDQARRLLRACRELRCHGEHPESPFLRLPGAYLGAR